LVIARQVKAKRLSAAHQATQVAIAAEQILYERTSLRLFTANHLTSGFGVALRKGRHP
jgi:hypothetical protein